MINNKLRIGNFTSSNIFKLMSSDGKGGFGAPAKTYIRQKNLERKLNRSIEKEAYSKEMAWGQFLEQRVLDLLGLEYELTSTETDAHPLISCWSGSKDLIVKRVKISDIKCFQLENFAEFTDVLLKKDTEIFKKEYPKEYWQLVSNAIINQVPKAEAISYCPFQSELDEIREMALNYTEVDQWKYRFIYESLPENLAHIEDHGYYNNLNVFEFTVPEADIKLLTENVTKAEKLLEKFHHSESEAA